MTEQDQTTELEKLCGSADRCFQLMRIWQDTANPCGGTMPLSPKEKEAKRIQNFKNRAKSERYSDKAIAQYLRLQGID